LPTLTGSGVARQPKARCSRCAWAANINKVAEMVWMGYKKANNVLFFFDGRTRGSQKKEISQESKRVYG
jgi:hypothetical protein